MMTIFETLDLYSKCNDGVTFAGHDELKQVLDAELKNRKNLYNIMREIAVIQGLFKKAKPGEMEKDVALNLNKQT